MSTTFVLVHGACHGGWSWRPVVERLRARGHAVYTPTLPGLNPGAGEPISTCPTPSIISSTTSKAMKWPTSSSSDTAGAAFPSQGPPSGSLPAYRAWCTGAPSSRSAANP